MHNADELWAKSDGETLIKHTDWVIAISQKLCHSLPFTREERDHLADTMQRIAALHDLGKAAIGFQKALREPSGKMTWGHRHEVVSAAYAALWFPDLPPEGLLAILTHHRSIPDDSGVSGERLLPENELPYEDRAEWRQMLEEFEANRASVEAFCMFLTHEYGEHWTVNWQKPRDFGPLQEFWVRRSLQRHRVSAGERRTASLLRGLLISSDHMASGHIKPSRVPEVPHLPSYERRLFRNELNGQALLPFQERCGLTCGHTILKAPTGSGKTLGALLWAACNHVENGRLFYVLPHTASLNAMHQRLRRIYGVRRCGILHHKSAVYLFRLLEGDKASLDSGEKVKKAQFANELAKLAREIYFPVRATTPHQILRCALKGQGWELALSEFPNACFIFDEIHAFEPKLFGLTIAMSKWLQSMGAKLLFASATLPQFAENLLREHLSITAENVVAPNKNNLRDAEVLNLKRHCIRVESGTMLKSMPMIIARLQSGIETALLVCNHVKTSQLVFKHLFEVFPGEVKLLHARFNSRDRNHIEMEITGTTPPRLLVATQAVEVSLDLNYNCGYIEPAPADALGQRLGRINRKGTLPEPASVVIFDTAVGGELYDETLTFSTIRLLQALGKDAILSEQCLTDIVSAVYQNGYPPKAHEKFNQGLENASLKNFDDDILAGTYYDWLEDLLEKSDGQVELLPCNTIDENGQVSDTKAEYHSLARQKRFLEARQLLVSVRIGQFFALKGKGVVHFDSDLGEYITIQKYSTQTGLDLDGQLDNIL